MEFSSWEFLKQKSIILSLANFEITFSSQAFILFQNRSQPKVQITYKKNILQVNIKFNFYQHIYRK